MSEELDEFKTEILENLERAEQALLAFDQLPDNEPSKSSYDEVFRTYHNIKGAAGMLEWHELQQHVHQLENVLMQTKDTSSIPRHLINWFLKGNDVTRSIIAGNPFEFTYDTDAASTAPVAVGISEEFLSEVHEGLERISALLLKMENVPVDRQMMDALYRDIHSIKGACQLFNYVEGSNLSHAMESSLEQYRAQESGQIDKAHLSTLLLCVDLMYQCIQSPTGEDIGKEVKFISSLLSPFTKEVLPEKKEALVKQPKASEEEVAKPEAAGASDSTIRVQVSLLDRLMTLMGEMVLVRNQVLQYSSKTDDLEFLNLSQKLDVVTSELQEETMKTRMQPIGNILSKFQRVVRDIANTLDKKINLSLSGVETELDKTLIEAIKDPLTHIVRNSCDHGIESPEVRKQAGKSDAGTISIRAYHEGGQVIIDISDDGKGLSRGKLLKKAIDKGIVDSLKAEKMTDREVHNLIFAPGFSTAEQVTNLSGRGVGMDVVKSNIARIGGHVELSSVEGEGTRITLKIPLTLAIVPAMIVRADNDRFAIPQLKLVELVRVESSAVEYIQGKPVYRLRGNILPLVQMKEILGTADGSEIVEDAINIVVLNSDGQLFGIIVDEILDTADIVVKPLAKFLKPISIYSGATVLGDGSVAFIMDVLGISQKFIGARGTEMNPQEDSEEFESNTQESREFVLIGLSASAKHAIPLSSVNRMEEIKSSAIEYSGNQRVIRYRNSVLRIIGLNEILGYAEAERTSDIHQVIVARAGDQLVGLEVNQIIDVYSSRDSLDYSLSSHDAITGNLVAANEIIVVLDVDKIVELASPKKVVAPSQSGLSRILLVEDTESIRNKLKEDLESAGHEVVVAGDGVEGLRRIAENSCRFDLIISDIEMPRLNGFEFARKVRSISQLKTVPMIAFTTKNSAADLKEAKMAGFSTYLEKSKVKLLNLLVQECLSLKKRKSA